MKKLLLALTAAASLSGAAFSQSNADPYANVLAIYNFDNLSNFLDPNKVAYCAPCVSVSDLKLSGLSQSLHFSGGPDGSQFRCFAGWDTAYDFGCDRTDLSPASNTLSFEMLVNPTDAVSISGLSLDWKRPTSASVDSIQAAIFWEDNSGTIQHRMSDQISLSGTGEWNSLSLAFTNGSTLLPTGADSANELFHIELYASGGQGSTLFLDNISLQGQCAPIPEPAGALLLGIAGFTLLIRRRTRR